jgi:hypothetical protein
MPRPLKHLRTHKLAFRWLDKTTLGQINFESKEISLNLALMVASVYIHETIHADHPDWSEARVTRAEEDRMRRMTVKEIHTLARRLLRRQLGPANLTEFIS